MKHQSPPPPRPNSSGLPLDIRGAWWTIYDILVNIGIGLLRIAALFHKKLGISMRGRAGGVNNWKLQLIDAKPSVLIHAASRGEFEAVIPLIDALLAQGNCRFAVSFSSPSVEKTVANYPGLWASGYLPFDHLGEQLRFLARLAPTVILVAKHDIWPNMIRASASLKIPYIIINANFHPRTKRHFFLVSHFNRVFFRLVSEIWTISDDDASRIKPLLEKKATLKVIGDTRYDRTLMRALQAKDTFAALKSALGVGPVIVAGSTWPPEERIVIPAFASLKKVKPSAKLVIAPHELGDQSLERCRKAFAENDLQFMLFSDWNGDPIAADVLFIDRMGILADAYSVGWAAVVGGGFGVGVHSVLEPAAYRIPVAFGPNYHVSHEAGLLINSGGGSVLSGSEALAALWTQWMDDPTSYLQAAEAASNVVTSNSGATARVLERLEPYLRQK